MKICNKYSNFFCLGIFLTVFPSQIMALESNWKNPQEAYSKVCAYCHNTGVGPNTIKIKFEGEGIKYRADSIFNTVRSGLNAMPAFRQTEIDNKTLRELAEGLAKGSIK